MAFMAIPADVLCWQTIVMAKRLTEVTQKFIPWDSHGQTRDLVILGMPFRSLRTSTIIQLYAILWSWHWTGIS